MSYKNVVNTTQQENTRSNKNVKFFWRKPFSVETPSLGEKSFLGRSHFWGEALFGEKPFSGRSHFRGEAIFGEKPLKKNFHVRLTPLLSPLCIVEVSDGAYNIVQLKLSNIAKNRNLQEVEVEESEPDRNISDSDSD